MRDPYKTLGVPRNADEDAIRTAYRKLARKWHPDVNASEEAKTRFKEINAAHDILDDPHKRKLWDEFGDVSLRPGFDPGQARAAKQWGSRQSQSGMGGFDVEDLLGSIFGGSSSRSRQRAEPRKGPDHTADLPIAFLTAVRGGQELLRLAAHDGTERQFRVPIPPGAKDGGKVRLKGKGGRSPDGGPPGDLVVRLRVQPHGWLSRDGDDLVATVPITVLEALSGAKITVPTPWGAVRLTVPANTSRPTRVRLKGKGIRKKTRVGDLFVVMTPTLPTDSGEATLEAARALESAYENDVRVDLRL